MNHLPFLALLSSLASASPSDTSIATVETPETRTNQATRTLYVHPFLSVISATDDASPLQIPITLEMELEGKGSLAFQPTLFAGSVDGGNQVQGQTPPRISITGVQLLGYYRYFPFGTRHEGFFASPSLGGAYLKLSRPRKQSGPILWYAREGVASGIIAGGTLGTKNKMGPVTLYSDFGGYYYALKFSGDQLDGARKDGFALDLNFGIGFSF